MRKICVKLASILLIFVMCLTSLVGCGLVTTDTERDMNQVVATVQIEEGAPEDIIYKKDMVMAYLNYGYMYEQYYGYTSEQTFTLIIDSLVNNRIYVQSAIKAQYNESYGWDVSKYLSDDAKIEAEYNTIKAMNDLIDSYKTQPETEKADTAWVTARTAPTNAANKEKEINKPEYIAKGVITEDTAEYRKAYNKVIDLLRVNELLGDAYKGDIKETVYYSQTLKNYQESELITAYENAIKAEVRAKFTFAELQKAFTDKLGAQGELTNAELIEKFSSATSSDPILVGINGEYGYVYNLLLGADDVLTAKISEIKTEKNNENLTELEYAQKRKAILDATVITDQRSSWITSGYDFEIYKNAEDKEEIKFTGDYTFAKANDDIKLTNSLPFYGSVKKIKDATEDESAKYSVTDLTKFNLDSFIEMMEEYVYGAKQTVVYDSYTSAVSVATKESIYRSVQVGDIAVEYDNKMNELLFAFSTDPGSLNSYKGYLIKPKANTEEYMTEFAEGARELIKMGGNSYIMVATDYGYHVMFYSEILNSSSYGFASLEEYLTELYSAPTNTTWEQDYKDLLAKWEDDDVDTENYMYLLANSLFSTEVSNAVTKYQRETLDAYRYAEDSGVVLYEDRYADLLE